MSRTCSYLIFEFRDTDLQQLEGAPKFRLPRALYLRDCRVDLRPLKCNTADVLRVAKRLHRKQDQGMRRKALSPRHPATTMCRVSRSRRTLLSAAVLPLAVSVVPASATRGSPETRWFDVAEEMKRQAESWGDQSYGAVLVLGDRVVGFGPSRVVIDRNPDAHAERVAIWDAQRRLGRSSLAGSILYSTSRPCALCEAAAAAAEVERMYYGRSLQDAGAPRSR